MYTKSQLAEITGQIAELAKEVFGDRLDGAILYGSYARGDHTSESDIDIMVLADVPSHELGAYKKPFTMLTSELGLAYDIVVTVTLKDSETFERFKDIVPFYSNVKKEGVKIA